AKGRLMRDEDAADGVIGLEQFGTADAFSVINKSAEGRTQRYDVTINNDLTQTRRIVGADGLTTLSTAAGATFTVVKPDGTTISTTQTGDQRFGMLAPFGDSATARMRSGLTSTMKRTRTPATANQIN